VRISAFTPLVQDLKFQELRQWAERIKDLDVLSLGGDLDRSPVPPKSVQASVEARFICEMVAMQVWNAKITALQRQGSAPKLEQIEDLVSWPRVGEICENAADPHRNNNRSKRLPCSVFPPK